MSNLKLDFEEFTSEFKKVIEKRVGKEKIKYHEVIKNNGVVLHGITMMNRENVSPTLYIEWFFRRYLEQDTMEELVDQFVEIVEQETPKKSIDMAFFEEFDQVKKNIRYKLVSKERNANLLETIPYRECLDLVICYYCHFEDPSLGKGNIMINNEHMKLWKTSEDELFKLAVENTPKDLPIWNVPMLRYMQQKYPHYLEVDVSEFDDMIYVISNEQMYLGAIALLYPGELQKIALKIQSSFYVIPSSVHELIVIKDDGSQNAEELRAMIEYVNESVVSEEEFLSNNPYYYDFNTKELCVVNV